VQRQLLLDKMGEMGKLLDETANLVRKLCTELRPGILDDLGLIAAIEWQAREYQNRTGIQCQLNIESDSLAVDSEYSTALFRIFQEVLTNVARHAKATAVNVSLKTIGPDILLTVADNGRGITEQEKIGAASLGLLGMRERAVILGGDVGIRGVPGKGTTVEVRMPIPHAVAESPTIAATVKSPRGEAPRRSETHKPKRKTAS
jgi:signal transduction histidine kinase